MRTSRALLDAYGFGRPEDEIVKIPDLGEARAAYAKHQATRPDPLKAHGTPAWTAWCDRERILAFELELAEKNTPPPYLANQKPSAPSGAGRVASDVASMIEKFHRDRETLLATEHTTATWKVARQALYNLRIKIQRRGQSLADALPPVPKGRPK
jgi:hypothetical protein